MSLTKKLKALIKNEPDEYLAIKDVVLMYTKFFHETRLPHYFDENPIDNLGFETRSKVLDLLKSEKKSNALLPGKIYEALLLPRLKKELGQVFTPVDIIEHMITTTDIIEWYENNPYLKILDPACGTGEFLLKVFQVIHQHMMEKSAYYESRLQINKSQFKNHLIENNLFGYEKDYFTSKLAIMNISILSNSCKTPFIFNEDYLFHNKDIKYDIIIGNPPYIGHKNLEQSYKTKLKEHFQVFNDKSDIYYCFFEKGYFDLTEKGVLSYITSRYFIEANYSEKLRAFISKHYTIKHITDYAGYNPFSNANVSPLIITLIKEKNDSLATIKRQGMDQSYKIKQSVFHQRTWQLANENVSGLINKIKQQASFRIADIYEFNQGIITGLDKAFIVNDKIIETYGLETELLKKWIKGSLLKSKLTSESYNQYKLIYTNGYPIEKYPNIYKYLSEYKDRLGRRRECIRGYREWYHLQWPRDEQLFEREKIIFPYKSKGNYFTYDDANLFFSADIYMMWSISNTHDCTNDLNYLNSDIFEFLIKTATKRIGVGLYEYYPYNLKFLPYFHIPKSLTKHQANKVLADKLELTNCELKLIQHTIK